MQTLPAGLHLLACDAGRPMASVVAQHIGTTLVETTQHWFACGEGKFVIEQNVRGGDLYVFQSAIGPGPQSVYDRFVMLLHAVEAAALSDAAHITAVIPYFPGARQDKRKDRTREGISAGLFARCLQDAGAHRVVTVDIHNEAIGGMFDPQRCRLENVHLAHRFAAWLHKRNLCGDLVASPDVGGLERARHYAEELGFPLVAISKERDYSQVNTVRGSTIIGNVRDRDVLLVDDIVDTAGSVTSAVEALKAHGARDVIVATAHALFSGPALDRLQGLADRAGEEGWRFQVAGTTCVRRDDPPDWFTCYAIEPLLADVIRSLNQRGSVTHAQQSDDLPT